MDIEDQFSFGHLLLQERKCRTCGVIKDLVDGYYKTRKGSGPSAYAYECKSCTIKRIKTKRKHKDKQVDWSYPDW